MQPGTSPDSIVFTPVQSDAPVTRVYPLGGIASSIDFKDLERTLREVLDQFGASQQDSKLAFHDKLNVLIVRGGPATHDAVAQVISALTSNANDQQRLAQENVNARMAVLQSEIKMLEVKNAELQERLQSRSVKPPAPESEPKR